MSTIQNRKKKALLEVAKADEDCKDLELTFLPV
jgi:hypothetical protein